MEWIPGAQTLGLVRWAFCILQASLGLVDWVT